MINWKQFMARKRTSKAGAAVMADAQPGSTEFEDSAREELEISGGLGRSPWLKELDRLRTLPSNWDSYGAAPPNAGALSALTLVLGQVIRLGLKPTRIAPSAEGGAAVCFVRDGKYADIECFNSGEVLAVTSTVGGTPEVWQAGTGSDALTRSLKRVRSFLRE